MRACGFGPFSGRTAAAEAWIATLPAFERSSFMPSFHGFLKRAGNHPPVALVSNPTGSFDSAGKRRAGGHSRDGSEKQSKLAWAVPRTREGR